MAWGERPVIMLFGSSIVQYSFSNGGWGAILADIYARKADVILRGYQGWNSRRALHVLHKLFPKVRTYVALSQLTTFPSFSIFNDHLNCHVLCTLNDCVGQFWNTLQNN